MNASAKDFVPSRGERAIDNEDRGARDGLSGSRPQYRGRIKTFNSAKGFGFIQCEELSQIYKRDVFLHQRQFQEAGLQEGDDVIFEIEFNSKGYPQARRVQHADATRAAGGGAGAGFVGMHQYAASVGYPSYQQPEMPAPDATELMEQLLRCSDYRQLREIFSRYHQQYQKEHAIETLYRLAHLHTWQRSPPDWDMDKLRYFAAVKRFENQLKQFKPLEAIKVLWSLNQFEEEKRDGPEAAFAFKLCKVVSEGADRPEVSCRYTNFVPSDMVKFLKEIGRLIRNGPDDELIGEIITKYNSYVFCVGKGDKVTPRFPKEELSVWTTYLAEQSPEAPSVDSAPPMPPHPAPYPGAYGPGIAGTMPPYGGYSMPPAMPGQGGFGGAGRGWHAYSQQYQQQRRGPPVGPRAY